MVAPERPAGPCVCIVVDSTVGKPWMELFKGYLLRYMQLLHDKVYDSNVRWSSVLLHPESALYNNPVTVGDWKSTKEALNEFATLIPPPNHKDKGKARAGRRVPLLDGLVAALESLNAHAGPSEPQHILLLTSSDVPTLDCLDEGSLDSFPCLYNSSTQCDGFGFKQLASELRTRSIHLSLITTQYLPHIEGFQKELTSNETFIPALQQLIPPLNPEHYVSLSGLSAALERKGRKSAVDAMAQQQQQQRQQQPQQPPFSASSNNASNLASQMPSSGLAAGSSATQPAQNAETVSGSTSIQLLTPTGNSVVETAQMSLSDLQRLKNELGNTVKALADRLQGSVREGKMDHAYAKRIYESIAQKGQRQAAQIDAFMASRRGTPNPGALYASPQVPQPSSSTAASAQLYQQQQQQQQSAQPSTSTSPPKQAPPPQSSHAGPQPLWSGSLAHVSFDPQTGQRKELATMLEIYASSRTQPSDFVGAQWPQKLEFNKLFTYDGPALQAFVQNNQIPIVNLFPTSAATILRKKVVSDANTAQMIERVYTQFAAALRANKSVVLLPFGPTPQNGLLLMASGDKLAGLYFGKVQLPEYLLSRQPSQPLQRQMPNPQQAQGRSWS